MAAQHSTSGDFGSRYKYNGKELDKATGWYYYGARYYDPSVSNWLSVDPLAEKYMSYSPYNYTLNNPINLVDPDGRSVGGGKTVGGPGDPKKPKEVVVPNRRSKYGVTSISFIPDKDKLGNDLKAGTQIIESKITYIYDVYTLQDDDSYKKTGNKVKIWSETTTISSDLKTVKSKGTIRRTKGPSLNNQSKGFSTDYDCDGAANNFEVVDFVIKNTRKYNQALAVTAFEFEKKSVKRSLFLSGVVITFSSAGLSSKGGVAAGLLSSSGSDLISDKVNNFHKPSDYYINVNLFNLPKIKE